MPLRTWSLRIAGAAAVLLSLTGAASALPPGLVDEIVVDNWDQSTGIVFVPDGRAFVWEKKGRVWLLEDGHRSAQPVVDIVDEVRNYGDYGLIGLAVDPNFLSNGRIYLLYEVDYYYMTHFGLPDYDKYKSQLDRDCIGRITRYTCNLADGAHSVVPGSRTILLGESLSTGFPQVNNSHGLGTLAFGEDGSLFAGCGDGASWAVADNGGPRDGSSNTGVADGVIQPKEDIGAFRAQLPDSLAGKVVRISPETGDGLPDNPFYSVSSPRSARSRVWALGFRNPYRFSVRPGTSSPSNPAGRLYVGDVGWYSQEEIDIVAQKGQNFGWPIFEGLNTAPEYPYVSPLNQDAPNPLAGSEGCDNAFFSFLNLIVQDTLATPSWPNPCDPEQQVPANIPTFMHTRPVLSWGHGHNVQVPIYQGTTAIGIDIDNPASPVKGSQFYGDCVVGGVWYTGTALGEEYTNTYFAADFTGGWIKNLVFHEDDDDLEEVRSFADDSGQIVCLAINPADESLYYISYGYSGASALHRISASGDRPPVVKSTMSAKYGASPLTVKFSTYGTFDPEGSSVFFWWDFGDGSTGTSDPHPEHVFVAPDAGPCRYNITLTVSDETGNMTTVPMFVTPNNSPPQVEITSPQDGLSLVLSGSQVLDLRANISDAETPAGLTCTWQEILHHNTHTHPQAPVHDCQTQAIIQTHGAAGDTAYDEFELTVTDPQGLETKRAVSVFAQYCAAGAVPLNPIITCPHTGAYFGVEPEGVGPFTYQWQREVEPGSGLFVALKDGTSVAWGGSALVIGASNQLLSLVPTPVFTPADAVRYRCIVSNACGSAVAAPAQLQVCIADFDCTGFVDTDDFDYFVRAFEAGSDWADADYSGFVDTDDFDAFIHAFEAGC